MSMCLALSQQCKTPLLLQKEPVKKKNTITEGTWLHHQGAPVCNNLTSCHLPRIADIGTVSMLWGEWFKLYEGIPHMSASWMRPWASGTKTEFAITACMLSVKINITFWSNAQTSISYNPALCCTFYSYKYSGCIDTDADPMQLAPNGTHEEWFKSLLSKSTTTVWHADMTKHWWRSTNFLLSYGISLTDNKNPALVWLS